MRDLHHDFGRIVQGLEPWAARVERRETARYSRRSPCLDVATLSAGAVTAIFAAWHIWNSLTQVRFR